MKQSILISSLWIAFIFMTNSETVSGRRPCENSGPWKALFEAARHNNLEKVEEAIKNGVDVNIRNENNDTILHVASEYGGLKVAEFLVANGSKIDAVNSIKSTPLHKAIYYGSEKIARLLLRNGADVNAEGEFRSTPLHWAVAFGTENLVELLIHYKANINVENSWKQTPLHIAVINEDEQKVKILIENGAYNHIKNIHGKTPDMASEKGFKRIVELLNQAPRPSIRACKMFPRNTSSYSAQTERILGGERVGNRELPWMAALAYVNSKYEISYDCAGTIISEYFILTAAHCMDEKHIPLFARVGITNLTDLESDVRLDIKELIPHPNYTILIKENDIGLIRMKNKIEFSTFVTPACLQTDLRDELSNVTMFVSGWGTTTAEKTQRSNELMKTRVKTIPLAECNNTINGFISESQYCAYVPESNSDNCNDDNEGPLQFIPVNASSVAVAGVVSFGIGCGLEMPGIYTRVAYYVDWIESIVWPNP